jgi:hypothetical protein
LEVLALEIQMYTETKNNKKLKVNKNTEWSNVDLSTPFFTRNFINNVFL